VALPPRAGRGAAILENTRAWIRMKLSDVFRRHRILTKMEKGVRADQFTQPGDPMRIDYGYRYNGTRGYVQALSLSRDPAQAKVLAYTAECVRVRYANSEFAGHRGSASSRQSSTPIHCAFVRRAEDQRGASAASGNVRGAPAHAAAIETRVFGAFTRKKKRGERAIPPRGETGWGTL
jgi:hypothetical protein